MLFFELANPGVILPGVIGGISLILAFFALQSLPINYAGLLLIAFGIVLLIAEIHVISHGVLAIGGVIAMGLGSLMLFDAPEAEIRVSWTVILPTVLATAGIFFFGLAVGVRALRGRPTMGSQRLVGQVGVARSALAPAGNVFVQGELWQAVAEGGEIKDGEKVTIVGVENLTLKVRKAQEGS